ncbi:DUF2167 domain-containing protein [Rhizobium sp. FKL33]|uniref:DUF2167 domain-containing protein n=1 Tax=Rhizobium sp. FKL33 TaxID=2562307 RepID=UPI001FEE4F35|nr:DUF2167 domain-containing protein [Rhizobium sp. FKL33]
MRRIAALIVAFSLPNLAIAASYEQTFGHKPELQGDVATLLESLDYKQGALPLVGAPASLTAPDGFYYLDARDSAKVLIDLWGNPPASAEGVMAMIFPKEKPPESESWGGVISYSDEGYVSDVDAQTTDYTALLTDLQQQTSEANPERVKAGYEPITLVGWASAPHYDPATHALHWARELQFGADPASPHTLNYQLRVLGREGVLNVNFVAGMPQLASVQSAIPAVINQVKYDADRDYASHRDGDRVAAYGLAGLIATAAGAKVAAKAGILAMAAIFLKKGFVFILMALAAAWRWLSGFFRKKKSPAPPSDDSM